MKGGQTSDLVENTALVNRPNKVEPASPVATKTPKEAKPQLQPVLLKI